ncbi:hypothetical protein BVX99_00085, partial [bacterium F16]
NVTARTGQPYIKRYVEEREQTLMFVVDLSASGKFGSVEKAKNEVAAEICALLAFSAIKNNDKIGLIIFTDHVECFVPPQKGTSHVLRLIRDLLSFEPKGRGTDINAGLDYLGKVVRKRSIVFLVSDFICADFERSMRIVSRKHDLIAISLRDPHEINLPNVGLIDVEDAETGERLVIDTASAAIRTRYSGLAAERHGQLSEMLRKNSIDHAPIVCGRDYVRGLITFFKTRERRQQYV